MKDRKLPDDPVLKRLPIKERRRQLVIRQNIAREYMGLPPLRGPGRPKKPKRKQISVRVL